MDSSNYKDITTTRGLNYHYYFSPPKDRKPFLLLLHGFPSVSLDWHNQVSHFHKLGYGLIVPDMLGYGGTAKPTDTQQYASTLIVKDILDILDAEKAERCIVISHDWGSKIAGRLANLHPDRFVGFGFLVVGYFPPNTQATFEELCAEVRKTFGRDYLGYQQFLSEPDAPVLCEKNFDSFYSLIHARDAAKLWVEHICPFGATRAWVEANKQAEFDPNIPVEVLNRRKELLLKGGLEAPFCWYKVVTGDVDRKDNQNVPPDSYFIDKPTFLATALQDSIALPAMIREVMSKYCKDVTVKEFNSTHWIQWDSKDELNAALDEWLKTLEERT